MTENEKILKKITLLREHGIISSEMFTAMRGQLKKDVLSVVGFLKNSGYDLNINDLKLKIQEFEKTQDYKRVFYANNPHLRCHNGNNETDI